MAAQALGSRTTYDPRSGIYASTVPGPDLPPKTLYEHLLGGIGFDNDVVVFTECKSGRAITLGQLKLQAQRLGLGLLDKGKLKPGDTILIMLHSSIDFVVVLMGAQFVGLKVAITNPDYLATELKHAYTLIRPKKVVINSMHFGRTRKAFIPCFDIIFTDYTLNRAGVLSVAQMLADEASAIKASPHVPANLDDTAYMTFSSGTTGMPKAVEITHKNVVCMLEIMVYNPGFLPDNGRTQLRLLSFLPFFHAYALVCQVYLAIRVQGHCAILRPFNPVAYCELVKIHKVNMLHFVPPVLTLLSKHPKATPEAFSTAIIASCGAAPLDAATQAAFQAKTGVPVMQGWGMSESTVGGLGLSDVQKTPGSVGCLLPLTQAMIVDVESGTSVGPGQAGELLLKGGQVCKGYFGNPTATRESITPDGYFRTGDVAVVDAETGEFSIVDRLKELIKYKGFQVAPAELEGVLVSHPKVAAAAVIGLPDPEQATELPMAFVELSKDCDSQTQEALKKELDEFVRKKVSHHKFLRGGIKFIPKVPVSASGKVLRKDIRKLLKAETESKVPQPKL